MFTKLMIQDMTRQFLILSKNLTGYLQNLDMNRILNQALKLKLRRGDVRVVNHGVT